MHVGSFEEYQRVSIAPRPEEVHLDAPAHA